MTELLRTPRAPGAWLLTGLHLGRNRQMLPLSKRRWRMQQILLPVVGALVGGGTAMLVSGDVTIAAAVGVGTGIGTWLAARKQQQAG